MSKIMLVEDDNNLREIYEARLQAEGYTLVSAKDGEEALVLAKNEKPDLVISDVMMPKISGFEMLDILRNTEGLRDVKVIMLTALGQSDDQQRANRLGADRYLVKSQVTLEDIVKVAHDLLQDEPAEVPVVQTAAPMVAGDPTPAAEPTTSVAPTQPVIITTPVEPEVSAPVQAPTVTAPVDPPVAAPAPDPVQSVANPATSIQPTEPALVTEPVAVETPAAQPEPTLTLPEPQPEVSLPETPVVVEASSAPAAELPVPTPELAVISSETTDSVAQSTADEEANVEARIEDFVEGSSTEAPAPEISPTEIEALPPPEAPTSPEPVTEAPEITVVAQTATGVPSAPAITPQVLPLPDPTSNDNAVTDDKLMDDAVKDLLATTEPTAPVSTVGATLPVAATAQPEVSTPPAVKAAADAINQAESSNNNVNIAHKLVLTPIDSGPKQDINTLLALEEAKEAAAAPPAPPTAVIATNENGAQAQPLGVPQPAPQAAQLGPTPTITKAQSATAPAAPQAPVIDPNSIAL